MKLVCSAFVLVLALTAAIPAASQGKPMEKQIEKLSDVQRMLQPAGALIITSDKEMEDLERDPNMKVRAFDGRFEDICKSLSGCDGALINVAYDFFFGGKERNYFPTSPQCIRTFKALYDVAHKYGVGFGASILSPLDLGPGYYREKKRGGQTHQFQEGEINPDGSYSVPLHIQRQWFHNKGPVKLYVRGVKAFAFSEHRIGKTSYYAVDPNQILDISKTAHLSVDEKTATTSSVGYGYAEGAVSGRAADIGSRNRVLVVVIYDVEEMDYFSPDALPFLKGMLDAHKAAGIVYDSFYSDEMHIQFDWDLGTHFGLTEISTRYVTPGLIAAYCRKHGNQYKDFDKYLIYFSFAQHGFLHTGAGEPEMSQHVFGTSARDIYATWKFRRDYNRLLTDQVVDLFLKAKRYGEKIFGRKIIWTRAHATWQESPTCDHVDAAWKPAGAPISRYDYTPAYDWSSSIREDMSACYDYFRWGDYLTGMGNDFPEGGWIDRDYYGAAMAASFGAFNDVPYSYWGSWGSPPSVEACLNHVATAYGVAGQWVDSGYVQGWRTRKSPVLALYPLDLNYVSARFGSWMVQYGYCDYLTQEKFAKLAHVLPNGHFVIKGREYTTLVALFEPMLLKETLRKIEEIGERGGKVVWTGPPAEIFLEDGSDASREWRKTFGVASVQGAWDGLDAEGSEVSFSGALMGVPSFRVLTHLLPDRVYPAVPGAGAQIAASVTLNGKPETIGTVRQTESGGEFVYFGARPRDDQSVSLPDSPRTLFHLLDSIGAYPPQGEGWAEKVSNSGDLLVCESPNGAVSITHHYYKIKEDWSGGFFRPKGEKIEVPNLPSPLIDLKDAQMGPYKLSYDGATVLAFRMGGGTLAAFCGIYTEGITINGREFHLADVRAQITYAPIPRDQLAPGVKQAWLIQAAKAGARDSDLILHLPFRVPSGAQLALDSRGNGRGVPSAAELTQRPDGTDLRIPPGDQGTAMYLFVRR